MAVRPINASRFAEILEQWKKDCLQDNDQQSADVISDVILQLDDMPTLTPPNEPMTMEQAKKEKYIWFEPLKDWGKVTPDGVLFFGTEERMRWETLNEYWGDPFKVYRYPPEGNDNV